jgi:hypothetical protein
MELHKNHEEADLFDPSCHAPMFGWLVADELIKATSDSSFNISNYVFGENIPLYSLSREESFVKLGSLTHWMALCLLFFWWRN